MSDLDNAKLFCDKIHAELNNKQTQDYYKFRYFRTFIIILISILFISFGLIILSYNKRKISDLNKIQSTVTQLKEQKIHLENLIKSTPAAIAVLDKNDIVTRINERFTQLFGYTENEAIGKPLNDLIISEEYINEGRLLSSESELKEGRSEKETKRRHKNGNLIDVFVIGSAIMFDNKFEGIYGIYQDISERKKNENELVKSKEIAENADKLKSVFLAQMSHEIRTPINAMVSLASLLKDDLAAKLEEDHKLSLELINKSGYRIVRTVDLLLNLSELQTGTYQPIIQKFDLYSDVLGKLIVDYKKFAREKSVKLSIKVNTNNTNLIADSYTVNQIFAQLIDNAIKYTDKGEILINMVRNDTDQLIVEIIDTGIGIAKDYLPNLFEPFSQEEMGYSRKYEGNGIGLSLVKNYCDLNKASVEVESEKDKGSVFRVIFPNGKRL